MEAKEEWVDGYSVKSEYPIEAIVNNIKILEEENRSD